MQISPHDNSVQVHENLEKRRYKVSSGLCGDGDDGDGCCGGGVKAERDRERELLHPSLCMKSVAVN